MRSKYVFILKVVFSLIFVVSFFSFSIKKAEAATWYISPTGTDDGSHGTGSGSDAWATINFALTGSRVSEGDIINVEAGTYSSFYSTNTFIRPVINTSSGSGPVVIQAYPSNATVTFDIPSNTSTSQAFLFLSPGSWTELTFKKILFTNSSLVNTSFLWLYGHSVTFEDCSIDMTTATSKYVFIAGNDTSDSYVTVRRSTIQNTSSTASFTPFKNSRTDSGVLHLVFESDLLKNFNVDMFRFTDSNVTAATLTNNTFIHNVQNAILLQTTKGGPYVIKNNIFYTTAVANKYAFVYSGSPPNVTIKNNVWYRTTAYLDFILNSNSGLLTIDGTNHWINPSFVNDSTDFSIANGSFICGRGSLSALPAGGDINGNSWSGSDVGAYKCSSASSPISLLNKVAFVGDSIMANDEHNSQFKSSTGIDYVSGANSAISGSKMERIFAYVDDVMVSYAPKTVFLSVGINNLTGTTPTGSTNQEYADYLVQILKKIEDWGATPIWLGIGTLNNINGLPDTPIPIINGLVETQCSSNGWSCGSYLTQMMLNTNWQSASPNGYYDTAANVHPNSLGQDLIGKFAEYLYYSKGSMGTNYVDIGAGARIFSDGKFRALGTTTGSLADITITPQSGSFSSSDKSFWLDITNITYWEKSGSYHKHWTESSSSIGSGSTIHTIGDLVANRNYIVTADGLNSSISCSNGICGSDGAGKITFTYSGGYSTHEFDVQAAPIFGASGASICSTSSPTLAPILVSATAYSNSVLLKFTDSSENVDHYVLEFGTKSNNYQYGVGNIGGKATTIYLVRLLSPNTTYYFRVRGGNGCATGAWSNEVSAKTSSGLPIVNSKLTPVGVQKVDNPSSPPGHYLYSLKVKVVDTNGKPLENATVTIQPEGKSAKTGKDGTAMFIDVGEGSHEVLIAYNEYSAEEAVDMTGNSAGFELNVVVNVKNNTLPVSFLIVLGVGILGVVLLSGGLFFIFRPRKF